MTDRARRCEEWKNIRVKKQYKYHDLYQAAAAAAASRRKKADHQITPRITPTR